MCCDTEILRPLLVFRQELYQTVLGHRKDSAFELLEAVLCAAGPEPLVRLSLAPPFRRGWASAPDALADGETSFIAQLGEFAGVVNREADEDGLNGGFDATSESLRSK